MRLALFLSLAPLVVAQDATNFRIELRISELRAFAQGELIPVTLRALGRPEAPSPESQERPSYRWQFAGFLVDPPLSNGTESCGTADRPCLLRSGGFSGRMDVDFHKISDTSATALNDYTRASIPAGRYRVSAVARKSILVSGDSLGTVYNVPNPPERVVSNAVEVQVVPATAQWIAQTIASSVATIEAGGKDYEKTRNAAKQLAFLDTPAAWSAALGLLPVEEFALLPELNSTEQPGPLCELMQARIPLPAQSVTSQYLSTLTSVCTRANVPQPPPQPQAAAGGIVGVMVSESRFPAARLGAVAANVPNPEMQVYFEKQRTYFEELTLRSTNALAVSLSTKQAGAPKTEAIKTLLGHLRQLQYNRPRGAMPGWTSELASAVVSSIASLNRDERLMVLPLLASTLPAAGTAPAFEAVMNEWKPGAYIEEANEALRALYKVDPRRAKERIVAELKKDQTWLEPSMLALLPASDAPPMDDVLLAAPLTMLHTSAIARYATPEALPRVRALYEAQTNRCQPELIAYFLRVDDASASQVLRSTATEPCLPQYFQRTASLIMTPAFEGFIVPYLMNGSVHIKSAAAQSLGRYGSEAAQKPLWDTLRYFHEYWDGKAAELAKNGEGSVLEAQLASAISRGRGWVVTEADLRKIQDLCIGERCLYAVQQDLGNWTSPLRLEVFEEGRGFQGAAGQYYGFETLAELEAKLAQFPSGTTFMMTVSGPSYEEIEARLRSVASSKGLLLQTR